MAIHWTEDEPASPSLLSIEKVSGNKFAQALEDSGGKDKIVTQEQHLEELGVHKIKGKSFCQGNNPDIEDLKEVVKKQQKQIDQLSSAIGKLSFNEIHNQYREEMPYQDPQTETVCLPRRPSLRRGSRFRRGNEYRRGGYGRSDRFPRQPLYRGYDVLYRLC